MILHIQIMDSETIIAPLWTHSSATVHAIYQPGGILRAERKSPLKMTHRTPFLPL